MNVRFMVVAALLSSSSAFAASSKRDNSGYLGTDSRAPGLVLPASFLTLPNDATTTGDIASSADIAMQGGDDQTFNFDFSVNGSASLYGNTFGTCQVHVNGFISCGGGSSPFVNESLPSNALSGRLVIAPFWDDLVPVATSSITFERKDNEWVSVQWNDFAPISNLAARLTFRATIQLDAVGNRGYVVMHYLKGTGTDADGARATIGIANFDGHSATLYSFNRAGAVLTGTAAAGTALQAILFSYDADGDRLSDRLEVLRGTDPALIDTDTGGLDDGAEVATGKDPLAMGDDAASADGDSDTVSDLDEAFYGTNPALADTDGDTTGMTSMKDDEELFLHFTDPTIADTDGDGARDGKEVLAGTDPRNPYNYPSVNFPGPQTLVSDNRDAGDLAVDPAGNMHIVMHNYTGAANAIYYSMVAQNGTVLIPEVALPTPNNGRVPSIQFHDDRVFIVYENYDGSATTLRLFRLNPGAAPQNGSAVAPATITEVDTQLNFNFGSGVGPREPQIALFGTGASLRIHIAYQLRSSLQNLYSVSHRASKNEVFIGVAYARVNGDGSVVDTNKIVFTTPNTSNSRLRGHAGGRGAAIAVDASGNAHLVVWARPKGVAGRPAYYVGILPSGIVGPYYLTTPVERGGALKFADGKLFFAHQGGARDGAPVGLTVFDPNTISLIPRVEDAHGVTQAIDPASMTTNVVVLTELGRMMGLGLELMGPNHAALIGFSNSRRICFMAFTAGGTRIGDTRCGYDNMSRRHNDLRRVVALPNGNAAMVFAHQRWNSPSQPVYLGQVPAGMFDFEASGPSANLAPQLNGTPSTSAAVGATYMFTPTVVDELAATALTWSLVSGPTTMSVGSDGTVSWTPTAQEINTWQIELRVCDPGNLCDNLAWTVAIPNGAVATAGSPPQFQGLPATTAEVGKVYSYAPSIADPDNDVTGVTLVSPSPAPGDMAIGGGGLTWTPTAADIGSVIVKLEATDATGLKASQQFTLTVVPSLGTTTSGNGAVLVTSVPGPTAVSGAPYTYTLSAKDPSDAKATFTYELSSAPSGDLALTSDGKLTWRPTDAERGSVSVSIKVTSSSGLTGSQSFSVLVLSAGGGCNATTVDPPFALAVVLSLLWVARRRLRVALSLLTAFFVVFAPALASAKHGPRDLGGYVGTDSRAPALTLSSQYLDPLMGATSSGTIADAVTLAANGDDASYPLGVLPGGASLYGSGLGGCEVHTNGIIVCGGSAPTLFSNTSFPQAFPGRTVLAPFWDDLAIVPGSSSITYEEKAGEWFIVRWTDFCLFGDPLARLTFQVIFRLNDPNNRGWVGFQYLKMSTTGSGAVDGSSATIGIKGPSDWIGQNYSVNMAGAVITGDGAGTALQAILFDNDADGDRLSDLIESELATNPALRDTDTGGLDDGAEVAAGKDPNAMGDDAAGADGDGDGLEAGDEAFYGTNPALADTDGDSIVGGSANDGEELNALTDPTASDTDGDGRVDGQEFAGMTNPNDPTSPGGFGTNIEINGGSKHFPQVAADANGDLHVVIAGTDADIKGVLYYMVSPGGVVKIPETLIKPPIVGSNDRVRRPAIAVHDGKVYITYELRQQTGGSRIGFIALNPALAPRDGSPVVFSTILTAHTAVTVPGAPRYHSMGAAANGVHTAFSIHSVGNQTNNGRDGDHLGFGYARINFDGTLAEYKQIVGFNKAPPQRNGNGGGSGVHFNHTVRVAVDSMGVAHLVMHMQRGGNDVAIRGNGMYYARVGSAVEGPYYVGPGRAERATIDVSGKFAVLAYSGGDPNGALRGKGFTVGVLDTTRLAIVPRFGDDFGIALAVDPDTFVVPWTLFPSSRAMVGAAARILPGERSALVGYFYKDDDRFCLRAFAFNGTELGTERCFDDADKSGHRFPSLAISGNLFATVIRDDNDASDVPLAILSLGSWPYTSAPVPNLPPIISSPPPSTAFVAVPFSYTPVVTDPDNMAGELVWSLPLKPNGMTISTSGTVSWTATSTDVGAHEVEVSVCDPGNRCDLQRFIVTVPMGGSPVITSTPPAAAVVGKLLQYQVIANDPDGNITSYSLPAPSPLPGNLAIDNNGLLTWTPGPGETGSYGVTVRVTDAENNVAEQSFYVVVVSANAAPSTGVAPNFVSLPATVAVAGRDFVYQAIAVDPSNPTGALTYSLVSTAVGDLAVSTSGKVTWKPTSALRGTHSIAIEAKTAGGATAVQTFSVTVIDDPTGGCNAAGGGSGTLSLALLLLASLWIVGRASNRRRA